MRQLLHVDLEVPTHLSLDCQGILTNMCLDVAAHFVTVERDDSNVATDMNYSVASSQVRSHPFCDCKTM